MRLHRPLCLVLLMLGARLTAVEPAKPRIKHMIDTHIHLYDTTRSQGVFWPKKSDAILYKPHLPAKFNRIAKKSGVTGVVIVEASNWIDDNRWLLDLVKGDDLYIGLVGYLELNDPNFGKHLERLRKDKRLVGIRARPRLDFSNKVVQANLRTLAKAGLALDTYDTVANCRKAASAVPGLRIVANHALAYPANGKPVNPDWIKEVRELASHPNVWCKISGLYQHAAKQPAPKDMKYYKPLLDVLWQAFGPQKLIYGSNWPVTKRSGDYASFVALVNAYFADKGQENNDRYFWKNASKAYGLKLQ